MVAATVAPMLADLDVVVLGGGGHVGLPLSLAFAQAGLRVGIYDISQPVLDRIAAAQMPFKEAGADELLAELLPTGRLEMSTDGAILERTNQVVVVIGTPVDEFLGPSMTVFERAVAQISPHLRDGALVVLRSTVYPGTTAYVAQHLAQELVGAVLLERHLARGEPVERRLADVVDADPEAGLGKGETEGKPDVAASAKDHDV